MLGISDRIEALESLANDLNKQCSVNFNLRRICGNQNLDDAAALKEPDSDDETMQFLSETHISTFNNLLHYMLNHPKDKIEVA